MFGNFLNFRFFRDGEIATLKQGHGNTMLEVEDQVKSGREGLVRRDAEISKLKSTLSMVQTELDERTESYNTLKGRAKAVATELKDRRVEVRNLTASNDELITSNAALETQVTNLSATVNQHEITLSYKEKDLEVLNDKVKELNKQIEQGKDRSLQDRSVGEKAIASYKRKAQEALAAANARLAAANQAREEAEGEAKSAKSASDDAVERARIAESKKAEAEQMADDAKSSLETERESSAKVVDELKDAVEDLKDTVSSLQSDIEHAESRREDLVTEIDQLNTKLMGHKEKNSELREQLIESNSMCETLQRQVQDLNGEVQRSSAAAFKRAKEGSDYPDEDGRIADDRHIPTVDESDGTILMLQQELQGATEAIAELKLALRTALLEKADAEARSPTSAEGLPVASNEPGEDSMAWSSNGHGNDSTPLFFAIEKQNELNTARNEINRLANMLGDAESSKQEAFDAMQEMWNKMEEANARLERYEKLGMKTAAPRPPTHASYGPFRNNTGILSDDRAVGVPAVNTGNDSVVNLEYLKNVMLSFLTAKTLADRRKLVPVVSTVLCLTPEEHDQAISSVEQNAGLTGVATSFWENIESKAHQLM